MTFENEPTIDASDSESVRLAYDRLAPIYDDRWRQYIDATLQIVEQVVRCDGDERILDVPCGTGELERRLSARWPALRFVGVDLSREMLDRAAAKNVGASPQWVQADVRSLPLPDESFDWVICANGFHYFRSPELALAELRRVLRPGGRLVLVDWCDDYLSCKLCSAWLHWTNPAFHRTYSLRRCRSMLEQAGLLVEDAEPFRIGWLWGLMRFVCRRPA